ncbi:MAG: DUF2934 domain-containing protein [Deltaproteobacteria bacterium]|nr:DUF2934 domain-containing protein [Deltaproteobacteria bacterium]
MPQARKRVAESKAPTEVRRARARKGAAQPAPASGPGSVDPEVRLSMSQEAAYYRALGRGASAGTPEQDWSEAEAEIDGMLSGMSGCGH